MRSILLTCLLAACGAQPTSDPATAEPAGSEATAPEPSASTSASTSEPTTSTAPPADAALHTRAITVDGAKQPVWLGQDGVLHVGSLDVAIEGFVVGDPEGVIWSRQASLEVVTFDDEREAVVLALPTRDDEDPPNHYRVWIVHEGALLPVFDQVVGTYGVHPLILPGDGTVRYVEGGWGACSRLEFPAEATRQEVVHRWSAITGSVNEERTDTEQVQRCEMLAACPFVYLVDGDEETFVGEVLRNIRGRENAALQPLVIGATASGALHVRIREEKEEVTFLDELYAEVDGVQLQPVSCADADEAFCAADGVPFVMRPGDELDVRFELPAAGELTIWARGYYVPTPTAATHR